jgi:hypothetical protein
MSAYAKNTTVSVSKSRAEIEDQITRFGCDGFMSGRDGQQVVVAFKARNRQVAFRMTLPDPSDPAFTQTAHGRRRTSGGQNDAYAKEERRMWRALCLSIKAKLVSVEEEIETFEQAFMAHIVMPDGLTIADHVVPRIEQAYKTGEMPRLLPGPGDHE